MVEELGSGGFSSSSFTKLDWPISEIDSSDNFGDLIFAKSKGVGISSNEDRLLR